MGLNDKYAWVDYAHPILSFIRFEPKISNKAFLPERILSVTENTVESVFRRGFVA